MSQKTGDAERIKGLRKEIARHDRLYYVENAPTISDAAYDALFDELQHLEARHPDLVTETSPTQRVGAAPESGLAKVEHIDAMLSLNAVKDEDAVAGFLKLLSEKTGRDHPGVVTEPKYDGVSIEVVYEKGLFLRAVTRGDGRVGEDISHTLKTVRSLPLRLAGGNGLPDMLAVRGEAILPKDSFQTVNKIREQSGEDAFANPRNAAAGILRRLDPKGVQEVQFALMFYDASGMDRNAIGTQWALLDQLQDWGLTVGDERRRCTTAEDVRKFHDALHRKRDDLAYEIDGIVLKLDDLAVRDALGTRARSPRWALAWKFEPRKEVTRINDIAVSVGRTGALTPVALLDPVDIGGVTVARATLHNVDEVARKDLRVGDTVRIERAGDVIPEVAERIETPERPRGPAFEMPDACPACGAEVERRGPIAYCPAGVACPAQVKGRLVHYASRGAMDIDGLGDETADQLVTKGLVKDVADIYGLTVEDIEALAGFAHTSAVKLHDAIHPRGTVPLDRFLVALGIENVGRDTARRLAMAFGSLAAVQDANRDALCKVEGVGAETARSVRDFFHEARNRKVIERLLDAGVKPQDIPQAGDSLAGKTFVLTGALDAWTREQATDAILRRGGRVASGVSGHTDYVVIGADPGRKLDEAKAKGVKTLNETEFKDMLT
ncbi:NAD-dependent DNA ligase LigA [Pseudogemmobacter sp. W21_MBD1_M6]|uniref:NAD-dependent DNA ligase LigA n=1 Tax=Pseudogemmobacter sp. W21_MBD1_M6 TaxID=3240271 RepID=UPI003F9A2BC8